MSHRRVSAAALLVAGALVLPVSVAAEAPVTTAPAAPPTVPVPVPAPEAPSTEAAIAVGDEAAYRAALASLSAAPTGLHTIVLTADITVDDGTDPAYTGIRDLTIDGRGFALDAAGTSRLLVMDSPTDASLTMTDVTVRNGRATGDGGGVLVGNASTVEVRDSRFEVNEASGSGGAIAVPEVASVVRSDFMGNLASTGDGGALDAAATGGDFVIQESQFVENRAPSGDGGALSATGSGSPSVEGGIQRSTFVGNQARRGGALVLTDGGTIANSTIVDNTATVTGGGILGVGQNLSAGIYLTLTGNAAPEGANAALIGRDARFLFSVFADPAGGGENCVGSASNSVTEGHADDESCGGDRNDRGAPELGPLVDNGGRTLTREPLPGSPLIDAIEASFGSPSIPGGCARFLQVEGVDQRGLERPQDGDGETRPDTAQGEPIEVAADCDIGAVEARAFVAPPTGPVPGAPPFTG